MDIPIEVLLGLGLGFVVALVRYLWVQASAIDSFYDDSGESL